MYSLYVETNGKMTPIGNESGQIVFFKEDKYEEMKKYQNKSYSIGRPMWIVYKKEKENGI